MTHSVWYNTMSIGKTGLHDLDPRSTPSDTRSTGTNTGQSSANWRVQALRCPADEDEEALPASFATGLMFLNMPIVRSVSWEWETESIHALPHRLCIGPGVPRTAGIGAGIAGRVWG